jgi:anti-anti-sigma regulatory factor
MAKNKQIEQPKKEESVILEGSLTVDRAEELRLVLIKAIIDAGQVELTFGSVTGVDVACLQLLCSAHRSALRLQKRFVLSDKWPEPFKQAVIDAGYARLTGCRLDKDHSCIWVKNLL